MIFRHAHITFFVFAWRQVIKLRTDSDLEWLASTHNEARVVHCEKSSWSIDEQRAKAESVRRMTKLFVTCSILLIPAAETDVLDSAHEIRDAKTLFVSGNVGLDLFNCVNIFLVGSTDPIGREIDIERLRHALDRSPQRIVFLRAPANVVVNDACEVLRETLDADALILNALDRLSELLVSDGMKHLVNDRAKCLPAAAPHRHVAGVFLLGFDLALDKRFAGCFKRRLKLDDRFQV